jgi:Helix-turn-helix domain
MADGYMTPPAIAKRLGIKPSKVLAWIRRGELLAINVVDRLGGRPRWRISPAALAEFERMRQAVPEVRGTRRRRKDKQTRRQWFSEV